MAFTNFRQDARSRDKVPEICGISAIPFQKRLFRRRGREPHRHR